MCSSDLVEEDVRPLEDIVAGIKQKNPQTLQDLDRKDLLEAIDSMILNEGLRTHDQTIKRLHEIEALHDDVTGVLKDSGLYERIMEEISGTGQEHNNKG